MSSFIKNTVLISALLLSVNATYSAPPPKPNDTAEACRQVSLKLDWLGRYQDRQTCTENLDGQSVYFASNYILANRISDAKELLDAAIIKAKYAMDINCYGQDDIKDAVTKLQSIQQSL